MAEVRGKFDVLEVFAPFGFEGEVGCFTASGERHGCILLGLVASRGAVGARGFAENGFSGKFHSAFIVDSDAFHFDQVAHLDGVVDALDSAFGQLGDVNQAVATGKDFDKGAEILEGDDTAFVGLADLDIAGEAGNELFSASHGRAGVGVETNGAVVFHVHLGARFGADAFDGFATRSDEKPDLILSDFKHLDLGGVGGELVAMAGQDGGHELEDVVTSFGGAVDGVLEHRQGETGEFEIELESSDSFGGAAKFEVHIAEVVFAANDVGQHLVTEHFRARGIELGHESDTDARNGGFEGNASVEEGKGATTDGGHGGGAVGFHNFRGDTNGVAEFRAWGYDRLEGAFG